MPLRHPHAHPARGEARRRAHEGGQPMSAAPALPARRTFLATSGALVVSFTLWPSLARAQQEAQNKGKEVSNAPALPASLEKAPLLDSWIRIDANGAVTVFTGKVELGQGIKTALIQVAAEELVVDPSRIRLMTADTAATPDEG